MESRLIVGGGVLLLALGVWNAYALHGIESRMVTLEGSDWVSESSGASASDAAVIGSGASGSEAVAMAAAGSNTSRAPDSQRRSLGASSSEDGSDLGVESGSLG